LARTVVKLHVAERLENVFSTSRPTIASC